MIEKHCDNCKFAYIAYNFSNEPQGQHCWNKYYNDPLTSINFATHDLSYCQYWEYGTKQFQQRHSDAARGLIDIDKDGNIIDSQRKIIDPIKPF